MEEQEHQDGAPRNDPEINKTRHCRRRRRCYVAAGVDWRRTNNRLTTTATILLPNYMADAARPGRDLLIYS